MGSRITVAFVYDNAKGWFVEVPGWKPGGGSLAVYTLATELAKDPAYDVRVVVRGETPDERIDGVRLVSRVPPIGRGIPGISRVINRSRTRKPFRDADRLVMLTTVATESLPEYQPVVRAMGGRTVYRIAADFDVKPEARGSDGSDRFTRALLQADCVIAQTDAQAAELRSRYGKDSVVISPSFRIPAAHRDARKDSILWVGQCYALKRPWAFLELARAFPDEKFVMIAPRVDVPYCFEAIEDSAARLPNVEFIESVPFSEIQAYFDRAKVLVNTSLVEGFPNTLHQAAVARTPILSLLWNADEYITKHGIGLCADGDMGVLITQLGEFLSNPAERVKMGDAARQRFEQHHDVERAIEQYKRVFRSLVGDGG